MKPGEEEGVIKMIAPDGSDQPYDFDNEEAYPELYADKPSEPFSGRWERFKARNLDLVLYLLMIMVLAYWVAIKLMFRIVGG